MDFKPKNIVLSGGSIYGIAHLGALNYLNNKNMLTDVVAYGGSSIGSIMATFLSFGFTIQNIWELMKVLDTSKAFEISGSVLENLGLSDGVVIYNYLNEIFKQKTGIDKITFKQHYEIMKKKLIIVGTCVNTMEAEYFDYERTPDVEIAIAVRASTSIPGIFSPVIIKDKYYIDGSIMDNMPIKEFGDPKDTLGILLRRVRFIKIVYPEDYLNSLLWIFSKKILYDGHEFPNLIIIKCIDITVEENMFGTTNEIKQSIYDMGSEGAEKWLVLREFKN